MIPAFLVAVPKLGLALLATVAITGGAVGVSAATGGPNLPEKALHAVGIGSDATGTPSGTPAATSTVEFVGLCRAAKSGSTNGQAQKQDAVAFQRLQQAAGTAKEIITEYCAPILADANKTTVTPAATETAEHAQFVVLCKADQSGPMQPQDATMSMRLQQAATAAGQTVTQYCVSMMPSPDKGSQGNQTPQDNKNSTMVPNASPSSSSR